MTRRLCGEDRYPSPLLAITAFGIGEPADAVPAEHLVPPVSGDLCCNAARSTSRKYAHRVGLDR
ncbi:MAG: hypothetical protein GEU86_00230 [Actinophytocola sp.]|nr:hypothetical protein [Actinophytocola sp.]